MRLGALLLPVVFFSITRLSLGADKGVLYLQKLEPYPFVIVVPATIGGTARPFLLNTGVRFHILDSTLKGLLGPYIESRPVTDGGNTGEMRLFEAPEIAVGGWKFAGIEAGVTDFDRIRDMFGMDLRGVIGVDAMKECAVSLDFDHKALKILKGNPSLANGMQTMDLGMNKAGSPMIQAMLGGKTMQFVIDTGFDGYIGLPHDVFEGMVADGMIKEEETGGVQSETAGGAMTQLPAHFTKGRLLGVDLTNIPVRDAHLFSNIGVGFLLDFDVVIDFKNLKFHYKDRGAEPPIAAHKMFGANLRYPRGHNHVYYVSRNAGAALDAGFKVWDHIVRLGPLKEGEINDIAIYELCLNHAGETLEVEIQRPGEERPIVTQLKLPEKIYAYQPRETK